LSKKNIEFAKRRAWQHAACILLAAWLAACASKPPPPVPARARLVAAADTNPDSSGRPSPIVVRLFELRDDGEFASADFFALYDNEKTTLAQSLLSREEYVLSPGDTHELDLPLNPQARYIGVIAAFRDIRTARWRALARAPEKKLKDILSKVGVTVGIAKDTVTLTVQD
jgi:type VI secretion system protein VasD